MFLIPTSCLRSPPIAAWLTFSSCLFISSMLVQAKSIHAQEPPKRLVRVVPEPPATAKEIASIFRAQGNSAGDSTDPSKDVSQPGTPTEQATDQQEITQWLEQLGANEFAVRERATARLWALGDQATAALREAAETHADIEVRLRAADVLAQIKRGQRVGRIDAFLQGDDSALPGWDIGRKILGDGIRVRELYVDMLMRHGIVLESLDGNAADRKQALASVILSVQRGMFVESRLPTQADTIALLLCAADPEMELSRVDQDALFSVLRKEAAGKLNKDPQLSSVFRALMGAWVLRSTGANQASVIWFALGWEIPEALDLALNVIAKAGGEPETLTFATQAVTRFGTKALIPKLVPLLKDSRPATEQQYSDGKLIQAQVRDAAMAGIVLLSGRQLSEFGMNDDAVTPRYGFMPPDIGFPTDDPEPRKKTLAKIKSELLAQE